MAPEPPPCDFVPSFPRLYQADFGFTMPERAILVDDVRVRAEGGSLSLLQSPIAPQTESPSPVASVDAYFHPIGRVSTPVYRLSSLGAGVSLSGPCLVLDQNSTVVVEPGCSAHITSDGDLYIDIHTSSTSSNSASNSADSAAPCDASAEVPLDPVKLSVFAHRFMSIAEQMGRTLQRTSVSTNIKERLDFSCALFGPDGSLVANAPHLPVHLGAMQEAVKWQIKHLGSDWKDGDVIVSNHPCSGGSHLPDITVITPVFQDGVPVFYVASRGHHADIGGISPGSMPAWSKKLAHEGAAIRSFKLVTKGAFQEEGISALLTAAPCAEEGSIGTRCLKDNLSDLKAQVAANHKGILLVQQLIAEQTLPVVQAYMNYIQKTAEDSVRDMLRRISLAQGLPEVGTVNAVDLMDDGTQIRLALTIDRTQGTCHFDFSGTFPEVFANTNAPRSVTLSAIIYCLRSLVSSDIPLNQGCMSPVTVTIPAGCILSPSETAAVVGGNVLTSQRVTDVVLKAFGACAASQGCMNNFTFGNQSMGYYETIAGGAGAGPNWHGESGVHTHMTNTRITDPEVLERRYPVLLREFSLRQGSGGRGKFRGGDGVVREIEFLEPLTIGILSERRAFKPYGLKGGEDGAPGLNLLYKADGRIINLGGKNSCQVDAGDRFKILTPGGGGYGSETGHDESSPVVLAQKHTPSLGAGSVNEYLRVQESA
eukprot:GILI01015486.1.p1 GENE.GILI01015486.1~~GILI01015486.1.p1  ORF type:complete len:708 (+),score=178.78 GILI01015486.1:57-2180(+)